MESFLFRIDIESANYKKHFLSVSPNFIFGPDNPQKLLTNKMVDVIIETIGAESWESIIKDKDVVVNIVPVSNETILFFDYVRKFQDVDGLVDLAFNFTMFKNGSLIDFTKLGLFSQGMSLLAALLTLSIYKDFPFCYECILVDILILVGFVSPILMKRSADSTRYSLLYAIQESLFPEPKNVDELKKTLRSFVNIANRNNITTADAIYLSFKKFMY